MTGLDERPRDTGTSMGVDANLLGLLAYLLGLVSGLVILLLEKRHAEVRFHAAQSIVTSVAVIVVGTVAGALAFVPVIGLLVSTVIWAGSLVLWVYLLVQGYRLEHVELPVLGRFAVQLAARA